MEKILVFPKHELKCFYEGIRCFNYKQYERALVLFDKAKGVDYIKCECLKYIIDCHIELHHFDEVYRIIENEFIEQNLDEEYLIKKYLYTMVLEEQYLETLELIKIYQNNHYSSNDLKKYLNDLKVVIEEHLNSEKHVDFMKYLLSDSFEDHLEIIFNIDKLDVNKYIIEIERFLTNPHHDSYIKYTLLSYLMENQLIKRIRYTNYFNETFIITPDNFINLFNHAILHEPVEVVYQQLYDSSINKSYIQNMWTDFCVKYFPHLVLDIKVACTILHGYILKSLNMQYNIDSIGTLYQVDINRLLHYFNV